MADSNRLYSLNGAEPKFLPDRIRLSNGMVRSDVSTYTDEELKDAGFTGPYTEPDYDLTRQERHWNSETLSYDITDNPLIDDEELSKMRWVSLKQRKNQLLSDSDYIFVEDYPITEDKKQEWREYRTLLRNFASTITDIMQYDDIEDLPWPTKPS
jgi:trehalose-6-phosphate synthase|tara:strand:+ start:484 stop:948 length:465 start_codon:yes stop_codon:yes gene_type:complete